MFFTLVHLYQYIDNANTKEIESFRFQLFKKASLFPLVSVTLNLQLKMTFYAKLNFESMFHVLMVSIDKYTNLSV